MFALCPDRFWLVAIVLALAWAPPALADLTGIPAAPPPLSRADDLTVAENPALAAIAQDHPWLLRTVLRSLVPNGATPRETGVRPVPSVTDLKTFNDNPALGQLWRSNPAASLNLLQLIRSARQTSK
ncbi:hypothetical protein [Devosia sp. CAU 1758]